MNEIHAHVFEVKCKDKGKGKCIYNNNNNLYSAHFCSTGKALRHGSHSFTCNYTNACLYRSVHQMAPPQTEVADI